MTLSIKPVIYTLLLLLLTMMIFETTSLDVVVQNALYNFSEKHWVLILDKTSIAHLVFYDGVKASLVLFALTILILLLFFRNKTWVKVRFTGLMVVFLSLVFIPLAVAFAKDISNVACPYQLTNYGGNVPYVVVFEAYPEGVKPTQAQRCFPAAHASGGFALVSLFFLARTRKGRIQAIGCALTIGWLMGGYKMLIGHHFLSHTLVSMIFSWLMAYSIALLLNSERLTRIRSFIPSLRYSTHENNETHGS
ncbi:phosphatase PAP2 family protein [Marinomonas algicola]|uniref:phosphatase PAP2 family protein n=1 Tax=Marinomonas algicola TaxID=2773454 RepID=UPI00174EC05B|nr:phosphatase PAP2 family protein [Marinomonas algicola]